MKKTILVIALLFSLSAVCQPNVDKLVNDDKPYANPVLIYGTDFGRYFKMLYKTGDFDTMLKFTSQKSIDKFGKENILEYYKQMDFGYDMRLKSKTEKGELIVLNYDAKIVNTTRVVRINVVLENDTSKIVLDNIMFHLGIDWKSVVGTTIKK